jgi:hypothetical protein
MPRPKADPAQVKLKRQQRIQRYKAKPAVKERIRIQHKSYKQQKKEQARLQLHLAQLADTVTQQEYLQDAAEVPLVPEPVEEREPINTGTIAEEESEILDNFAWPLDREQDGEYPDEPQLDTNDGLDGGFADEQETDDNGGFDGGFPDEPESNTNDDFSDKFSDGPHIQDDGSQSVIAC